MIFVPLSDDEWVPQEKRFYSAFFGVDLTFQLLGLQSTKKHKNTKTKTFCKIVLLALIHNIITQESDTPTGIISLVSSYTSRGSRYGSTVSHMARLHR